MRKVETFAETVEYDGDPVSVAAITLLDCWSRSAETARFADVRRRSVKRERREDVPLGSGFDVVPLPE